MALIRVPEQRRSDLALWHKFARLDTVTAATEAHCQRVECAIDDIREFVSSVDGCCYAGVSWGKDSVVLAHLIAESGVDIPLVWVRVEPIANRHCALVRDDFLSRWPLRYEEIEVWCSRDDAGWHATGTLETGFGRAAAAFGDAYLSGVRAEESGSRKVRMRSHGVIGRRTCAPIGWWSGEDVFGYLHGHDLPIHPAYAMSLGGTWERNRIRVASLGGKRGTGRGRREWEETYYPEHLAELGEL